MNSHQLRDYFNRGKRLLAKAGVPNYDFTMLRPIYEKTIEAIFPDGIERLTGNQKDLYKLIVGSNDCLLTLGEDRYLLESIGINSQKPEFHPLRLGAAAQVLGEKTIIEMLSSSQNRESLRVA